MLFVSGSFDNNGELSLVDSASLPLLSDASVDSAFEVETGDAASFVTFAEDAFYMCGNKSEHEIKYIGDKRRMNIKLLFKRTNTNIFTLSIAAWRAFRSE